MSVTTKARRIIWIRRSVQIVVLAVFLYLLTANRPADGAAPSAPVDFFFDLNPLVMVSTWLATHTLEGISLLGLLVLGITLIFGRVFCGWFCHICGEILSASGDGIFGFIESVCFVCTIIKA